MKNMNQLMKQAQQMQTKISALQNELSEKEVEASTGGGMVKVTVNGKQEILKIEINPECVDPSDVEMLQDMITSAVNQAVNDSKDMVQNAMNKITGGLSIPGLF